MNNNKVLFVEPLLGNIYVNDLIKYIDKQVEVNHSECDLLREILIRHSDLNQDDINTILSKFDKKWELQFINYCIEQVID